MQAICIKKTVVNNLTSIPRYIFGILIILFCTQKASAQNEALDEVNLQLRAYFSPLAKPSPAKDFLYDMSAHSTDSSWFVANSSDTKQTETWFKVYEEMYYAAYDTSVLTRPETIFANANNYYSDTIPIGIMNYSFYGLKPDAMNTDNYFNFDTVNNILSDKNPRLDWPYTDNNTIFMSAPLINGSNVANPVFVISPSFFFYDNFNATHFGKDFLLRINFGDGTGWHNYNPQITSYYQPNYSINQVTTPLITVQIMQGSTANIIGSSQSNILAGPTVAKPPMILLLYRV